MNYFAPTLREIFEASSLAEYVTTLSAQTQMLGGTPFLPSTSPVVRVMSGLWLLGVGRKEDHASTFEEWPQTTEHVVVNSATEKNNNAITNANNGPISIWKSKLERGRHNCQQKEHIKLGVLNVEQFLQL